MANDEQRDIPEFLDRRPTAKAKAPTSWRDVIKVHPAADLFPLMAPDELKALGEDIRQRGMVAPVVLWSETGDWENPMLLDGRNRLDAMELVGLRVVDDDGELSNVNVRLATRWRYGEDRDGEKEDPWAYVFAANIHRRHLTGEQKRELIAKVLKAQPDKSNRQIAKAVGVSHPHVGKVRTEMESTGDVETVSTSIDTKGRKQQRRRTGRTSAQKKRRTSDDFVADMRAKQQAEADQSTQISPEPLPGVAEPGAACDAAANAPLTDLLAHALSVVEVDLRTRLYGAANQIDKWPELSPAESKKSAKLVANLDGNIRDLHDTLSKMLRLAQERGAP